MRGNEAGGTSEQGSETRKDFLERKLILTFLERTGSGRGLPGGAPVTSSHPFILNLITS